MSSRDTQAVEQATEDGGRTSFMTLVDAATSQLDAKPEQTDNSSKQDKVSLVSEESGASSSSSCGSVSADSADVEKKLSFAEQLMSVLDDVTYSDVLQWMPDGKSFTITNPKKFTSEQMPKLFNIRNMSSFVRKLTRWGFSRVHERATMNSDIFKHPQFHKGEYKLCSEIKCTGRTSASSSSSSSTLRKSSLQAIQAFNPSSARQAMLLPPQNDVGIQKTATGSLPGKHAIHGHLPIQSDLEGLLYRRSSLSSLDQHVLAATVETIRRERELAARLAAARTEQLLRLERAQKHLAALGGSAAAVSGFPSLY